MVEWYTITMVNNETTLYKINKRIVIYKIWVVHSLYMVIRNIPHSQEYSNKQYFTDKITVWNL